MKKLKEMINWIGTDGLLHIDKIALIMLVFTPIIGFLWATVIAIIVGCGRETVQYITGSNNKNQVHHDMICNGIGYALGSLTLLAHWLCNL